MRVVSRWSDTGLLTVDKDRLHCGGSRAASESMGGFITDGGGHGHGGSCSDNLQLNQELGGRDSFSFFMTDSHGKSFIDSYSGLKEKKQ